MRLVLHLILHIAGINDFFIKDSWRRISEFTDLPELDGKPLEAYNK